MIIDMKVVHKGLQGKGNKTAVLKLAGEDGSSLKLILDSRRDLDNYVIGEILTVKIAAEQMKLTEEDDVDE